MISKIYYLPINAKEINDCEFIHDEHSFEESNIITMSGEPVLILYKHNVDNRNLPLVCLKKGTPNQVFFCTNRGIAENEQDNLATAHHVPFVLNLMRLAFDHLKWDIEADVGIEEFEDDSYWLDIADCSYIRCTRHSSRMDVILSDLRERDLSAYSWELEELGKLGYLEDNDWYGYVEKQERKNLPKQALSNVCALFLGECLVFRQDYLEMENDPKNWLSTFCQRLRWFPSFEVADTVEQTVQSLYGLLKEQITLFFQQDSKVVRKAYQVYAVKQRGIPEMSEGICWSEKEAREASKSKLLGLKRAYREVDLVLIGDEWYMDFVLVRGMPSPDEAQNC